MEQYEVIQDGDYKVTIDYKNLTTTFENRRARERPQRHGQNNSIKPIGFLSLVNSKNNSKFFMIIYL